MKANVREIPANITNILETKVFSQRNAFKAKKIAWAIARTVFLLGFSFVILYPVLNMISMAFKHRVDLYDNTVIWVPKHFTLENIRLASRMMYYPQALKNSMILALSVTIIQSFSCLLIGYGFARFDFPFKKILFALVILTIMVPPQIIVSAIYLHFRFFDVFGIIKLITGKRGINLLDSFLPFVLLALTGQGIRNGLFIYIFRQFFRGMPRETEEAALVDGAGPFRTFYQIMLPGARTAIVTVALFSFVWQWNDQLFSGLFLPNMKVLALQLNSLNSIEAGVDLTGIGNFDLRNDPMHMALIKTTGAFLVMLPPLVLYAFAQKLFVQSIERAGIVG